MLCWWIKRLSKSHSPLRRHSKKWLTPYHIISAPMKNCSFKKLNWEKYGGKITHIYPQDIRTAGWWLHSSHDCWCVSLRGLCSVPWMKRWRSSCPGSRRGYSCGIRTTDPMNNSGTGYMSCRMIEYFLKISPGMKIVSEPQRLLRIPPGAPAAMRRVWCGCGLCGSCISWSCCFNIV